jgi:hypothetical protein
LYVPSNNVTFAEEGKFVEFQGIRKKEPSIYTNINDIGMLMHSRQSKAMMRLVDERAIKVICLLIRHDKPFVVRRRVKCQ